ncbi:MAG: F420-0--gamma-glutamyl ligase [Candidatus Aegiribacteria sp.]|nr:F420-0--gamma-glutamyl ligase [Candidatus Aegiribacteria sp.]MBD3295259.1 F420-0--gamma-glutamyl ligase [Candidatus Fermentibacteria bacterium]
MKQKSIIARGRKYHRIPIRTELILKGDDLLEAINDGLEDANIDLLPEDILFVSEKAVGASQGRYYLLDDGSLKPRTLARFLSRFVTKTPSGIGLGMPETMECALRECGTARILFASVVGFLGKLIGRRGDFYGVAGSKARSIDGPTNGTIPPFNRAVSLAPEDPDGVSRALAEKFCCKAAVVDINDLGGNVLGAYPDELDRDLIVEILSDNPLGQGTDSTPAGIIRLSETENPKD